MKDLLSALKNMDIGTMLPEMDAFIRTLEGWTRVLLLAGPLVLVALGAIYLWVPESETASRLGFNSRYSRMSDKAWDYAQRLAAIFYLISGGAAFLVVLVVSLFFSLMGPVWMTVTALILAILELAMVITIRILINQMVKKGGK